MPRAGTWSVDFTDSSGQSAFSKRTPVEDGGLAVSTMYWPDVPAGQTFTGVASFEPSEASENWAFSPAAAVPYTPPPVATAPGAATPVEAGTEVALGDPTEGAASAPLWSLVAAGVAALLALIAVIVLSALLASARRRQSAQKSSSKAASDPDSAADAAASDVTAETAKETSDV